MFVGTSWDMCDFKSVARRAMVSRRPTVARRPDAKGEI